jgi:hypothetical protein
MIKTISGMLWAKPNHPSSRILMVSDKIRWTKEGLRVHKWYDGKGDSKYWTKIGPNELGHWREE